MSNHTKKNAEQSYRDELKKMKKLVGNKITYSDELARVGDDLFGEKFMGVFTADKIPNHIKELHMAIVNLDNSNETGSHWVSVCKDKKGIIWVYDSFGRRIHKILPSIYGRGRKIKSTERDKEQGFKETNCGARSLAFLRVFHKLGSDYAKYI